MPANRDRASTPTIDVIGQVNDRLEHHRQRRLVRKHLLDPLEMAVLLALDPLVVLFHLVELVVQRKVLIQQRGVQVASSRACSATRKHDLDRVERRRR